MICFTWRIFIIYTLISVESWRYKRIKNGNYTNTRDIIVHIRFQGTLVIQDVEFNVVKEMLNFIYCGRSSSEINELASDLLIAADKYRCVIAEFGRILKVNAECVKRHSFKAFGNKIAILLFIIGWRNLNRPDTFKVC